MRFVTSLLVAAVFLTLGCSEAPSENPRDSSLGDLSNTDLGAAETPNEVPRDQGPTAEVFDGPTKDTDGALDASPGDLSLEAPGDLMSDHVPDELPADAPPDAPGDTAPEDTGAMDVIERAPSAMLAVTGRPRRDDGFMTLVRLDASSSTGGALRWQWSVGAARVMSGSLTSPSLVVAVDGASELPVLVDVSNRVGTSRALGLIRLDSAPVAHAGPARSGRVGVAVTLDASGSVDREGDPISYRWSVSSAPEGSAAVLSGETTASPSLTPDMVGVYRVSLVASGSGGDSNASVATVTALPGSDDPPTVAIRVSGSTLRVGSPVTFDLVVGTALGSSVRSRTVSVNGMDLPVDSAGRATFTPTAPGAYTVVATVVDSNGNTTTTTVTVFASAGADDGSDPTVTLTAPADGAVLTGATEVSGTARDVNLARYVLEASPGGANAWRELASGTMSVTAGRLGAIVPSSLAADTYDLRVTAWDTSGRSARATRTFVVNQSGEVGANRLEFRDLYLDLAGIPITIDRIYDSFRPREGEFGANWTLSFGRVEQTATPGIGWSFNTSGFNCIRGAAPTELNAHVVTFRVLGQRYSFRFAPTWVACMLGGQTFAPAWQALPGTFATLRAEGPSMLLRPNSETTMQDYDDLGVAYNPQFFVLTLPDGTSLRYHRATGLVSARDPRMNTLSVSATEIRHSSGVAVSLTRDARGRVTRLARPDGMARTYRYNNVGDLAETVDFEGRSTRYRYGPGHRLAQIIDPMGNPALSTEYAPDGRVRAHLDALGRRTELSYDDVSRTRSVTDRLGRRSVEALDANGALLSRTDAAGRVVRYEYVAATGLRSAQVDAAGGRTSYQYNSTGSLTQVTLPSGTVQRFTYDAAGRMLSAADGLGHTTAYTYSAAGQLTRAIDLGGQVETRRYAASGALAGVTFASGLSADYETDPRGYVTGITERATRHVISPSGTGFPLSDSWSVGGRSFTLRMEPTPTEDQVAAITGPEGGRSTARYDGLSRATEQVNAAGDMSTASWGATGQIEGLRMADGTSVSYERDAEGQIVGRSSASGAVTRTLYDPIGRPTLSTLPSGATLRRAYGPSGITTQTDPSGRVTTFSYDSLGRQSAVTFPGSLTLRRTFDGLSRVRTETTPDGLTTTYERDGLGRVSSRAQTLSGGATATWRATWHGDDRPASLTDPNGNTTRWEYDAGALARLRTPLGGVYTLERDALGVSALVDPRGGRQSYTRDGAGNLTAHTLPSGARETFSYDLRAHRITRRGYDGGSTVRTIDASNRPLEVTAGDGTSIGWGYNSDGLRSELRDARGVTSVLYSSDGLPTAVVSPDGRAARYRYAPDGQLTEISTPHATVTRSYDAAGRLSRVEDSAGGVFQYMYDALGRPSSVTGPDGSTETRAWEEGSGRLASVEVSAGGSAVFRERYTYDAGGRVTRVQGLDGVTDYTYDAFDRLTAEVLTPGAGGEQRTEYTYDEAGNLTRTAGVSGTRSFSYDTDDRLTGDGEASYRYDAEGRLVEVLGGPRAQRLTWDGLGRLVGVVTSGSELGAHTVGYAYDADGLMASRTLDGVARYYLWDRRNGVPEVIEETDGAGALIARNIPGVGMRVSARVEGGVTRVFHGDRLGTVRAVTGGSTARVRSFTAYGVLRAGAVDESLPYGFAGERLDPATGSYYLRARHYAPTLGRFVSPDPLAGGYRDARSFHRYVYAAGSPTMFVDPLGTFLVSISISTAIQGVLNGIAINRYINIVQTVLSTLALFVGVGEFIRAVGAGLLSTPGAFRPEASLFGDVFLLGPYTRGIEALASSGVNAFSWTATYSYTGWTLGPIGLGAGAYGGFVFDCPVPSAYTGAFRSLSVAATSSFMTYSRLRLGPISSALDATPQRDSASVSIFWSPTPTDNVALPDGSSRTVQSWGASGGGGPAGVSISLGSVYGPLQFAFAWTDYTLTSHSGPDGAY